MRTAEAIHKHWCLVARGPLRSCIWTACLRHRSKERGKFPPKSVKTIGEACRQQAQALIESLILFAHDLLQQGQARRSGVRSAVCQATHSAGGHLMLST